MPRKKGQITPEQGLEMGKRYKELIAEGKKGPEATEIVNSEFGTDASYPMMRVYGRLYKLSCQTQTLSPVSTDDLEARIRIIVKQIVEETMTTVPIPMSSIHEADMPPKPKAIKGRGGKQNRQYVKVTLTIDKNLWDQFTDQRDKMGVSSGRLMDIILWRAFERPPLSYGTKDHQDDEAET